MAVSYEKSYTPEVAKKWASKGGKDAYIKAAKAWNVKKYGTTAPSAAAAKKKTSKETIAKAHKLDTAHKQIKSDLKSETHGTGTFYTESSGQTISGLRAPGKKSYSSPAYLAKKGRHGGRIKTGTGEASITDSAGRLQILKAVNLSTNPTATKANTRMQAAVDSANAPEDILTGKAKRKAKRLANRQKRKGDREKVRTKKQGIYA